MEEYLAFNKHKALVGLIDQEDLDLVSKGVNLHSDGYARIGGKYVHRVVLSRVLGRELPKGFFVDHINRNRLDNRRSNLRLATLNENNRNVGKFKGTSRFIGVSWKKSRNKWYAQIKINGEVKYLGVYNSEVEAAKAYNKEALLLHGEFATLNKV